MLLQRPGADDRPGQGLGALSQRPALRLQGDGHGRLGSLRAQGPVRSGGQPLLHGPRDLGHQLLGPPLRRLQPGRLDHPGQQLDRERRRLDHHQQHPPAPGHLPGPVGHLGGEHPDRRLRQRHRPLRRRGQRPPYRAHRPVHRRGQQCHGPAGGRDGLREVDLGDDLEQRQPGADPAQPRRERRPADSARIQRPDRLLPHRQRARRHLGPRLRHHRDQHGCRPERRLGRHQHRRPALPGRLLLQRDLRARGPARRRHARGRRHAL